jgi:DNA polymerase III epsilon subunit-like protein
MTSILRHPEAAGGTERFGASDTSSQDLPAMVDLGARFAIVDVETTGLDPTGTRMVEIAIVEMTRTGRRIDEFSTLLSIPGEGPLGADFIHRISRPMLARAPRFEDVVSTICQRLSGRIIVGHVIAFDIDHLRGEFTRAGVVMPDLAGSTLCTRDLARVVLPAGPKTLAACCAATGIKHKAAHTALGDARATAALLASFLQSGFDTHLDALSEAAGAIAWPELSYLDVAAAKQRSRLGGWLRSRRRFSPPPAPAR